MKAILLYMFTIAFGVVGSAILWAQDSTISTNNITDVNQFRTLIYSSMTIPTILNIALWPCGPFTQNVHAAIGSLLVVSSSCFWILYGMLHIQSLVTDTGTTLLAVGGALCWLSGVCSGISSLYVLIQHHYLTPVETQSFDALVDIQLNQHRGKRRIGLLVVSLVLIIAGICLILRYDYADARSSFATSASRFLDFEFCAVLMIAMICFMVCSLNSKRSKFRYLVLGAMVFLPQSQNTHSLLNAVNNFHNGINKSQGDGTYSASQLENISIGECLSYIGLLGLLLLQSGRFRKCSNLTGFYLLIFTVALTGVLVLRLTPLVIEFTARSHTYPSDVTVDAVNGVIVPMGVAMVISFCGTWMTSIEAVHATYYAIGYSGLWILPYSFQVSSPLTGSNSRRALIGSLLCFGAIVLLTVCQFVASRVFEKVRLIYSRAVIFINSTSLEAIASRATAAGWARPCC